MLGDCDGEAGAEGFGDVPAARCVVGAVRVGIGMASCEVPVPCWWVGAGVGFGVGFGAASTVIRAVMSGCTVRY
ncbi:hypothetical protein AB0G67_00210 [Streptomyces sp. NPDC021056]|uniref:hypothetical protein n=1 Tax=Streptomyces sp. NPDC021056 TaxID=3155012 RepID=UPI0033D66D82